MVKNKGFVGIDLGTSSIKLLLCDANGNVIKTTSQSYELIIKNPLYVEQNPQDWYDAMIIGLKKLITNYNGTIEAMSFSGQMHGLVILDKNDKLLHNAILWNDQRTHKEVKEIQEELGNKIMMEETANVPIECFTLSKILWLKKNKKNIFNKINKIMLPKDYLIYKLSNQFVTDTTDASGTGMFDVKKKKISKKIVDFFGINVQWLPRVCESHEKVGILSEKIKKILNIKYDVKIIVGAGDQAANAIGLGVVENGQTALSLGTSACLFVASKKFKMNENLHAFAHSNGDYHLMGVSQSGGGSVKWFFEDILNIKDYSIIKNFNLNNPTKVLFLPYLSGERHPVHDPLAKGVFIGMDRSTTKEDMLKAVLEGVAFSIKQMIIIINNMGIKPQEIMIAGGGGNNNHWMQILASILKIKISLVDGNHGGVMGAAIIAMVGANVYPSIQDACTKMIKKSQTFWPNEKIAKQLENKYKCWIQIYPAVKNLFLKLNNLQKT